MKMSNLLTLLKVGADVKLSKEQAQHLAELIEQQQQRITELEAQLKERDELAATVERLREQLSVMAAQHQRQLREQSNG